MSLFSDDHRRNVLAAQMAPRLDLPALFGGAAANALRAALGRVPVPSAELIAQVFADGFVGTVEALAAHPGTPDDVLVRLATDRRAAVAESLLGRASLPEAAAVTLAGPASMESPMKLLARGELPLWARLRLARTRPLPGRRAPARLLSRAGLSRAEAAAAVGLLLIGADPDVLHVVLTAGDAAEMTGTDWRVAVHAALASATPERTLKVLSAHAFTTATAALGGATLDAMIAGDVEPVRTWAAATPEPVWDALAALPDDPDAAVIWPAALTEQLLAAGELPLTVAAVAPFLPGGDPSEVALRRAALTALPCLGRGLPVLTAADAVAVLTDPRTTTGAPAAWMDACQSMLAATRPSPQLLAGVPAGLLTDLLVVGGGPGSAEVADLVTAAFAATLGVDPQAWLTARRLLEEEFPGTLAELGACAAGVHAS